jgi:hypothetical protein
MFKPTSMAVKHHTKSHRLPVKISLHPFEPLSQPWELITVDLVGPVPGCQGYSAILVAINWVTKAVKFKAAHLELNLEVFAQILCD